MRQRQSRATDTSEGVLQDTSNEETDPAWLVGALFMTSAMPEFSAYFRAGCDCGFDAFAVPVGKHMISAISPTLSGQTRLSLPLLLKPRTLD
jgi:hypothetical protein